MSVTSSQQQSNVEDNIADVLNGAQEYAIGDKRIKRANLKDLMSAQAKLSKENGQALGTRPFAASMKFSSDY
jgi:hypothetical protein